MSTEPATRSTFRSRRRASAAIGALAIAALLIPAARSFVRELSQPLYPVVGEVRVDGSPAPGAVVRLHREALPPALARSIATADRAGAFRVQTNRFDGAPAGKYAVTISWHEPVVSGEDYTKGPNVLPALYADPTTTPLSVEVARHRTTLVSIDVSAGDRDPRQITFVHR